MQKALLLLLVALTLFTVCGCMTTNMAHNRVHVRSVRDDAERLHREIDGFFINE